MAQHLSSHTPIPIPYTPPFDWARWTTVGAGILAFAVTLRFVAPILQSRWTWGIVSILTSLIMTSGFMFTRIRNTPFMGPDGGWIAGGYQNQFGQEVQVLSIVCACTLLSHSDLCLFCLDGTLGFAFLMLIMVIPYQTSAQRQRFQIYLWSAVIMLVYSILVVIFKVKNRGTKATDVLKPTHASITGYPFRLLL